MNDTVWASIGSKLSETGHEILGWLDQHALNIILILVGVWIVRRLSITIINRILAHTVRPDLYPTKTDRLRRLRTLKSLTSALIRTSVYMIAGILIIGEINPNYATALFASLGLFTVALGFSARDIVKDVLNGIFIVSETQYRVGDMVKISGISTDVEGTVEAITIRSTTIRDQHGNLHHVGNGSVTVATNQTFGFSSLNEELGVDIKTDLHKLEHVINHVGEEVSAIPEIKNKIIKAPFYDGLQGYKNGGLVIRVSGTTTPNDKAKVRSEFYKLLNAALLKHEIKLIGIEKDKKKDK